MCKKTNNMTNFGCLEIPREKRKDFACKRTDDETEDELEPPPKTKKNKRIARVIKHFTHQV